MTALLLAGLTFCGVIGLGILNSMIVEWFLAFIDKWEERK